VPLFDGSEATVTPLGVVAAVTGPGSDHRILGQVPFPGFVEQRVKVLAGIG
jgi:hypothetical protein